MSHKKGRTIRVTLERWQIKKLDKLSKRWWPSLKPRKCRASALSYLVTERDARRE